jgi:hypothetical protein
MVLLLRYYVDIHIYYKLYTKFNQQQENKKVGYIYIFWDWSTLHHQNIYKTQY